MADSDRVRAVRPLAALVPRLIEPALRKRGARTAALVAYWPTIVGGEIATMTEPLRLAPGRPGEASILYLRVSGASAIELQHQERALVERINTFFGGAVVSRLALRQGPLQQASLPRRVPRRLTAGEDRAVAEAVAPVDDEGLKRALTGLGRAIRQSGRPPAR
jgi:hypothetical protein